MYSLDKLRTFAPSTQHQMTNCSSEMDESGTIADDSLCAQGAHPTPRIRDSYYCYCCSSEKSSVLWC